MSITGNMREILLYLFCVHMKTAAAYTTKATALLLLSVIGACLAEWFAIKLELSSYNNSNPQA